jgi:hypothetical protein
MWSRGSMPPEGPIAVQAHRAPTGRRAEQRGLRQRFARPSWLGSHDGELR